CTYVTHGTACVISMPISSRSSRASACSTVSPGSSLPPGSSHQPAQGLSAGRCPSSNWPSARRIRPAATSMMRSDMARGPVAGELVGDPARTRAAFERPLQRLGAAGLDLFGRAAQFAQPVVDDVEVVVLLEGVERQPQPE